MCEGACRCVGKWVKEGGREGGPFPLAAKGLGVRQVKGDDNTCSSGPTGCARALALERHMEACWLPRQCREGAGLGTFEAGPTPPHN